ncbi:NACHT domain-containing protein [Streptomyces olivaceiscleroticus]
MLSTIITFTLAGSLNEVVKWTSVLSFLVTLITLFMNLTTSAQEVRLGAAEQIDEAAEDLARAVQLQWSEEERLRRLRDPFPLSVRWDAAEGAVTDGWSGLLGPSNAATATDPAGHLEQVVDVFERIPSKRLVVLGEPGSGKTALSLRFTLDLLGRRQPQDPVPVILPLLSWDPRQWSLRQWVSVRISTDYPALAAPSVSGLSLSWELVQAGRLLLVLDGFDEIVEGLRSQSMRELNRALDRDTPVVLTCRTDEYRATVGAVGVFANATVVQLRPLRLADLMVYFPRTAHPATARGDMPPVTKWDPVLQHMQRNPEQPVVRTLMKVLCTPLMTSLARAAYSDTNADPMELLDNRFTVPDVLENHLLEMYIPAAYADSLDARHPSSSSLWGQNTVNQIHTWLRWLAGHLDRLNTYDVAWWQMTEATPRIARILSVGLASGIMCGLVGHLSAGLVPGLAYGIVFALASGISTVLGRQRGPTRVELRFRGTMRSFTSRFAAGLAIGLMLCIGFEFQGGIAIATVLSFGLAFGMHVWLDKSINISHLSGPLVSLRQDRTVALMFGLSYATALGVAYGAAFFTDDFAGGDSLSFMLGLSFSPVYTVAGAITGGVAGWIVYGPAGSAAYLFAGAVAGGLQIPTRNDLVLGSMVGGLFGIAIGLQAVMCRAWGSSLLSRAWMALHGYQPWRQMDFLADAHRRGVLRQVGAVYQFRHARLQEHLSHSSQGH